jgi:glucokinase
MCGNITNDKKGDLYMKYIAGIDIGGTKCSVVLGKQTEDQQLHIISRNTFKTEVPKGPDHSIQKIFKNLKELIGPNIIDSIGISCGGPLDSKKGLILSPPNLNGWDSIPIVDMVEENFGIKTYLQNDANACALAEWNFGAAKGFSNVVFLTFGTGMGAGLIFGNKLYPGTNDMAGEIGHIRLSEHGPVGYGKEGSFEGFCSGGGIAQIAQTKITEQQQSGRSVPFLQNIDEISAKSIAEAAFAGEPLAREIYEISGTKLGFGLSVIIDILNPEIIVIGSIFERCRSLLWPAAEKVLIEQSLSSSRRACSIVPSALGDDLGLIAALSVAIYGGNDEKNHF